MGSQNGGKSLPIVKHFKISTGFNRQLFPFKFEEKLPNTKVVNRFILSKAM